MKKLSLLLFIGLSSLALAQNAPTKKPEPKNFVQSPILVSDLYTDDVVVVQISQKGGVAVKGTPPNLFAEENAKVDLKFEAVDYETIDKQLVMNLETLVSDGLVVKMVRDFYEFGLKATSENGKPLNNVLFEIIEVPTDKRVTLDAQGKAMLSPKLNYRLLTSANGHEVKETLIDTKALLTKKQREISVTLTPVRELKPFTNVEKGKSITLDNIFFDQSSAKLRSESHQQLNLLYDLLNQNPTMHIEIRGYTDNAGDWEMNVQLSKDRAKAVADFLTQKGVDTSRLQMVGRGPLEPVAPNTTEANRKKNRRVTFTAL